LNSPDRKLSRRRSSVMASKSSEDITMYLSEKLVEKEILIANKRVADFYPLKNIKFSNLFPIYNEYQTKMKNAKKKVKI
jgi:hypothetical protein